MKKVFVCEESITGIFSALYDAWKGYRNADAGIELRQFLDHQLFCEYQEVSEDKRKADAVERMIKKNLGHNTYWHIYHALLSEDPKKADSVFHVMKEARNIADSKKIMDHLTNRHVVKVFELSRTVSNEAHMYIEMIRFRELENGVMFSEITPRNHVLFCIGDHFANRFPLENWMIYDKVHKEVLVHRTQYGWVMVTGEEINLEAAGKISPEELEYSRLWKGFFEAISIRERENPVCQRTHLPLRYRKDMTEFN
ncbi:MAG: TIGR03915 family putative DNA repair protein [Ruminococcus sp.]|nr:TIGR03915 family putative DNA repair protein [Ruminococcus sp.]